MSGDEPAKRGERDGHRLEHRDRPGVHRKSLQPARPAGRQHKVSRLTRKRAELLTATEDDLGKIAVGAAVQIKDPGKIGLQASNPGNLPARPGRMRTNPVSARLHPARPPSTDQEPHNPGHPS
jgi:hypothetical protein